MIPKSPEVYEVNNSLVHTTQTRAARNLQSEISIQIKTLPRASFKNW